MKKIISIILCFMLLPLNFVISVSAAEEETKLVKVIFDTFTGTAGEMISGWSYSNKTGATYKYAADPMDSDNSVAILERTGTGSGNRIKMRRTLGNIGNGTYFRGDMVSTFRIYDASGTGLFELVLRNYDPTSATDTEGNQLFTVRLSKAICGYETGKWYDVRLEIDDNGTYSLWLKDGNETIYSSEDNTFSDSFVGFWQLDIESNYGALGTFYIDDFAIWTYEKTKLENITGLKEIYSRDFSGTVGEKFSDWIYSGGGADYICAQDPINPNETVIKLSRSLTGSGNRVKMYNYIAGGVSDTINDNLLITFRAYDEDGTGRFQVNLRDAHPSGGSEGVNYLSASLQKACTKGKWYNCFIEVKNNGPDDSYWSMWMMSDDEKISVAKNQKITTMVSGLCRLDLELNHTTPGDWYVDDLKVYSDFRDELLEASEELTFDVISNGQLIDEITGDLNLVNEITHNDITYPVVWESGDENLVSSDGAVTRRSFTQELTITAKVCNPENTEVYIEKDFDITVIKSDGATDEEVLQEYADLYLTESLFTDEEASSITKNLSSLPTKGADGIGIDWSSNDSAISTDGTVTRPEYGMGNAEVTLTATLTLGEATETKELVYTVLEKPDPCIDINATLSMLTYSYLSDEDSGAIRKNLNLPTTGVGSATISWESTHPEVISTSGLVIRGNSETEVTLTATVMDDGESDTAEFTFTVMPSVERMLQIDMGNIDLDDSPLISESFELPLVGEKYKTEFTWESDSHYLQIDGSSAIVYRPPFTVGDVTVNLSLTAVCDSEEHSFNYPVIIPCEGTDQEAVDAVMSGFEFSNISLETEESVSQNLALIKEKDGVEISWSAEGFEEFINTSTGEIWRPVPGEEAVAVTITATFTRGYANGTKDLTFTIVPFENDNQVIAKAAQSLVFHTLSSEDIDAVTQNLTLPTSWKYGTKIEWSSNSSNLRIEGEEGIVTRPEWGETISLAELTATISYKEDLVKTKIFNVKILEKNYMELEEKIWKENFETWDEDNMWKTTGAGWSLPPATEATLSLAADPLDEDNNVIKIDRTGSSGTGYVIASASKENSGVVYMGLRFYIEEGGVINVNGRTADCDQVPISISSSGVKATGYPLVDAEIKVNDWNTLDLIIDVNTERYQVEINGKQCMPEESDSTEDEESDTADGIPYNYYGQGRNKTIKSFRMNFAKDKVCYIDDLYMEKKVLYTNEQLNLADEWEKEFLSKNDINALTSTIVFPAVWADKIRVFYYTSDSNILDTAGMIQLPSGEADVVWKVGFNDGFTEYYKSYKIHVIKTEKVQLTDEEAVAADLAAAVESIKGSGMLSSLTNNLTIPTTGENGSTITAVSSDTSVLTNRGAITRGTTDKSVTLTVTVAKNGITKQEVLDITVAKKTVQSSTTSSSGGSGGGGVKVTYGEQSKGDTGIDITQPDNENKDKAKFNDLTDEHWAYSELMHMTENGIMNGTGDGNIQPERTILREEFIKMLVLSLGLDLTDEEAQFTDVSSDAWYAPYIQTAKKAGLVNGYEDGRVGIGEEISRQDMAVMIFRAAEIAESGADNLFGDDDVIADYAKSAVYTLKDIGVVNGKDNGNFAPGATATRAETACMLYRAIKKELFK